MKKLDSQQILHDLSWGGKAAISAVFFLIGLTLSLCSLYPLFVRFTQEFAIIAAVVTICFGGLLGLYFGLFRLWKILRRVGRVRRGEYKVLIDVVTSSESLGFDPDRSPDSGCYLTFARYSQETGKNVAVTMKTMRKARVGDEFYLVLLDGEKKPVNIYSRKEYIYTEQAGR